MNRLQRLMVGHGLLVILVSMLAGYMLLFSLIGGLEVWPGVILPIEAYGTTAGWVRAHTGGAMNGLLAMVVGLALPILRLSPRMERLTAYGFIYVAWSFTIFYWLGNAAKNRALTLGDNPLGETDLVGVLGVLPALPSVVIVVVLLGVGAKAVLQSRSDSD